jgi:5-deoxy-D-glucuronate isomerase
MGFVFRNSCIHSRYCTVLLNIYANMDGLMIQGYNIPYYKVSTATGVLSTTLYILARPSRIWALYQKKEWRWARMRECRVV